MDWKEKLASLNVPQADPEPEVPEIQSTQTGYGPQTLHVLLDKKGRKGKTATIIEGFTLPDDEIEEIASELKRKIGTGGSARGGEILLQGDWREKAAMLLRDKGYRVS